MAPTVDRTPPACLGPLTTRNSGALPVPDAPGNSRDMTNSTITLADDLTITRMGYGAMQLAGPGVFGPPKDRDQAIAVLREAVASGVDHIDTSDFYGPYVVNQIIREALHPYPDNLVIVTKVGAVRGADASWNPAQSPAELESAVQDNLRN